MRLALNGWVYFAQFLYFLTGKKRKRKNTSGRSSNSITKCKNRNEKQQKTVKKE